MVTVTQEPQAPPPTSEAPPPPPPEPTPEPAPADPRAADHAAAAVESDAPYQTIPGLPWVPAPQLPAQPQPAP